MQDLFRKLITSIGENPDRPGLKGTPERAAHSFKFLTQGYQQNIHELVNDALFESDANDMIVIKDIELYSLCEHHLLPFIGKCHIGYIPNGKVLGLSKFARITDMFSQRLQIQENLTHQIATAIFELLKPEGVAVTIEANHLCMRMRGVEKQNSMMVTSSMLGVFREDEKTRMEYLFLVKQ